MNILKYEIYHPDQKLRASKNFIAEKFVFSVLEVENVKVVQIGLIGTFFSITIPAQTLRDLIYYLKYVETLLN